MLRPNLKIQAPLPRYAFQFGIGCKMVHDTVLINLTDAIELWESCEEQFTNACKTGQEAEMAIWMEMENSCDYHTRFKEVSFSEVVL